MKQDTKTYTSHIIETEDGELAIELPPDALAQLGWSEGTDVFWDVDPDGNILIKECKHESDHSGK